MNVRVGPGVHGERLSRTSRFVQLVTEDGRRPGHQAECHLDISIAIIMMSFMRTTLTIEPDVEQLLQREMRRTNRSMKAVVNDALRIGLGIGSKFSRVPPFKVEAHAFGFRPGTDSDGLNQPVDRMEADEFARKQAR